MYSVVNLFLIVIMYFVIGLFLALGAFQLMTKLPFVEETDVTAVYT
jgi:hypothetical protein